MPAATATQRRVGLPAPPAGIPAGPLRRGGWRLLQRVEAGFDRAFGAGANPWRHLGALSFFMFWIAAASGIYVYAAFDTSVDGAYASVQRLTREQWYLGGVMRSLHRYASDGFVVIVLLHLGKEFLLRRYAGFRWYSWLTGVPLLWLLYASGIGGYWLVWDQLAQFSIIATAEWLDWLSLFAQPLTRNFLTPQQLSDRFFSLLIFLHIGIPLLLLLGMWVHIQRISHAVTFPPAVLAWGTLLALIALSLAKPALSHLPANLAEVPAGLQLDWFYLFIHPLTYAWSPAAAWAVALGVTAALAALPWTARAPRPLVARVDLANCNGCGRCAADCPYGAVILQPRTDQRPAPREARVLPELCAACGICAGACPSSTPFRSVEALVTGIDMPQLPVARLREDLERALPRLEGKTLVVVFGCDWGAEAQRLAGPDTAVFSLLCAGMLPPSFVEYALRSGAHGVLVAGCREGDCAFRLGGRWLKRRIRGEREPHLRSSVPPERVRLAWAGAADGRRLQQELEAFRRRLEHLEEGSGLGLPPKRRRRVCA